MPQDQSGVDSGVYNQQGKEWDEVVYGYNDTCTVITKYTCGEIYIVIQWG